MVPLSLPGASPAKMPEILAAKGGTICEDYTIILQK